MKSLWNDNEAKKFKTDLDLRVYTSRLLGQDSSLVLHGGGNTSVKSTITNIYEENEDILYVKGSGWDLATIKVEGFAPVKMKSLLKMSKLKELNDIDMVKYQRLAMTNPLAPNPSVEAILHAIIPFKFVDHTHADAVVTITNTQNGEEKIRKIYGDKVLVVPYIMPGFVLAKLIYDMTRGINWDELEGMVLLNHGLFTFNDDAKKSYEKTIELVSKAQEYLESNNAVVNLKKITSNISNLKLANIRKEISAIKGYATISILNDSQQAVTFSSENIEKISQQGPLTPDHVIRTKRVPAIIKDDIKGDLKRYVDEYISYFNKNRSHETLLNPAPNFAILPNNGSLSFGKNTKEAKIIKDINDHTFEAILRAEKLGGYKALSDKDIFDVEYWELEQAKLKKDRLVAEFSGKIALVAKGASGVGLSTAKMLNEKGCAVVVLDINPEVENIFSKVDMIGIKCDLTKDEDIKSAIDKTVRCFGGIDIVISNVDIFTSNESVDDFSDENLSKSMDIDLTSHQKLLKYTTPFLKLGIDPAIIVVASKNFTAPDNVVELICTMAKEPFTKTTDTQITIDSGSDRIILLCKF